MKVKKTIIDIIVIGDEVLSGKTLDINSNYLAKHLFLNGYSVRSISVVSDRKEAIVSEIRRKIDSDVLIVTGGLGPTPDDITRFAIAEAVGEKLVLVPSELKKIQKKLKKYSGKVAKLSEIEAFLPEHSQPLINTVGIAPGFRVQWEGGFIFSIPGVPREAEEMFISGILPFVQRKYVCDLRFQKIVKTIGIGESALYKKIKSILPSNIEIGLYPRGYEVDLILKASKKKAVLNSVFRDIKMKLEGHVYSTEENVSLLECIVNLCLKKKVKLAFAESCTGGLLSKRLTDISGVSDVFLGSFITYSNEMKQDILGVRCDILENYGAVSSQVARAMLKGIHSNTEANLAVSITGIAGPSGGTDEKPVGLVFVGFSFKGKIKIKKFNFRGDREQVRWLVTQAVFYELWKMLR